MAELSLETQAILARLKSEGDLLRNSGTNSIKSVKIELSKFSGLFETLKSSIDSQVETLQAASGFAEDTAAEQRRQNDLLEAAGVSEREQAELAKRRFQTEQLKADQDFKDQEDREKARQKNEKGFFKKMGGFFSKETFGKIMSGFKIAALAGVGLTLGYQFIAGFLEGFGVDVEKFEKDFATGFNGFVKFLSDVDWAKWGSALTNPLTIAGVLGLSALPSIIDALQVAAGLKIAKDVLVPTPMPGDVDKDGKPKGTPKPGTPKTDLPDADKKPKINAKQFLNWRTALLSAIGVGLISYSGEIGEFFKEDAENISKDDLANMDVRETSGNESLSIIAGAASLGSIFGIKGALFGAAIGSAYVIGKGLYDTVKDLVYDVEQLPNDIQSALRNEGIREGRIKVNPRAKANVGQTTVEEAAAQWLEGINTELQDLKQDLLEAESNVGKGNNRDKIARQGKIKRLKSEIELREQQIQNTENLLIQRAEQGIADFDIYTKGTQTLEEARANEAERARVQAEMQVITDGIKRSLRPVSEQGLDDLSIDLLRDMLERSPNGLANRASQTDMSQPPGVVVVDKSVKVNNNPSTVVQKSQKVEQVVGVSSSGSDSGSVYPGG